MAYTAPTVRTTGELVTASIWNVDLVADIIEVRAGGLAISGQAASRIPYASSSTQLATSAALTFDGTATMVMGPGGTGSTVANLFVDGGSASGGGSYTMYRRNSVNKGAIGTHSALVGGTSDNLVVYSVGALELASGSVVRGRVNSGGGLDLGSGTTVNDAWVGFYRDTAATSMWQLGVRQDVGGSNDDFKLLRFNTSAVFQDIPLQIATATGNVTMTGTVTHSGATTLTGAVTGASTIKSSGQPGFAAYNTDNDVTQSNGATVDFDTEEYDELGNFASDTFTAPVTGRYLFCVGVMTSAGSATQDRSTYLSVNGGTLAQTGYHGAVAAADTIQITGSAILPLVAADTVVVKLGLSTGTCTIQGSVARTTYFHGRLLV